MKRILLIGEKFSPNLGDGIIFDEVYYLLKNHFKIISLDFTGKSNYNKNYINKQFKPLREIINYNKNNLRRLLSFFRVNINKKDDPLIKNYENKFICILNTENIDAIVFTGGQLFMDCFLDKIIFTLENAEKSDIPIYFNACGKGIISNNNKIKRIFESQIVQYISVRDGYDYFFKYDCNNKLVKTYDTALLCNNIYKPSKKSCRLGIGIMISHKISFRKQFLFWKKIINHCIICHVDFKLFCNGNIDDYNFGKYILDKMHLDYSYIADRPTTPTELVENITKFDKIMSMRLHSLIVAYAFKIPAIAISWDEKVNEFYKFIKREMFCFNFNSKTADVINALDNLNDNFDIGVKDKISNNITTNIENIIININNNRKR